VIPLRPLAVGEILDGAISYIRANPKVTLGLSAVVVTLTQLIQVPAQYLTYDGLAGLGADPTGAFGGADAVTALVGGVGSLLGIAISFIAITVLTGLLIAVLQQAVLGRPATFADAWAIARPRLLGLVGLTVLTGLLITLAVLAGFVPLVVALALGAPAAVSGVLGVLFGLAGIALGVFVHVSLSMGAPVLVLERAGVVAALRRSAALVRPTWWRVFGILLLAAVIAAVIGGILGVPFMLGAQLLDGTSLFAPTPTTPSLLGLVLTAVGAIIATTITAPFSAGVTGLLYVDQRMRREAFDLELTRAVAPGPDWGGDR